MTFKDCPDPNIYTICFHYCVIWYIYTTDIKLIMVCFFIEEQDGNPVPRTAQIKAYYNTSQ